MHTQTDASHLRNQSHCFHFIKSHISKERKKEEQFYCVLLLWIHKMSTFNCTCLQQPIQIHGILQQGLSSCLVVMHPQFLSSVS